jgi:hypothetical protein
VIPDKRGSTPDDKSNVREPSLLPVPNDRESTWNNIPLNQDIVTEQHRRSLKGCGNENQRVQSSQNQRVQSSMSQFQPEPELPSQPGTQAQRSILVMFS